MISNGEVIATDVRMDDFVEVMLGDRFPLDFGLGNSPYPDLSLWHSNEMCRECGCFLGYNETEICIDCESSRPDYGDEPDVDEAQEWYDFDPDC